MELVHKNRAIIVVTEVEDLKVEWVMLADAVDIVNGKLYVLGGGWESVTAEELPLLLSCGIAVAISVPWGEANHRHQHEIEVRDADGKTAAKIMGYFEVGRPVGISPGSRQRVQIGMMLVLQFDCIGTYEVVVRVNDRDLQTTTFTVLK